MLATQLNLKRRGGLTLVEIMISLTVITVLLAASAPSVVRIMEQAHCDMAAANLRSVWNAQRLYWIKNRTYAASLTTLQAEDLLDASILSSNRYVIAISTATADAFAATASRSGSSVWSGQLTITEGGDVTGTVTGSGNAITPGI